MLQLAGKTRRPGCCALRSRSIAWWVVSLLSTFEDLFNPNVCLLGRYSQHRYSRQECDRLDKEVYDYAPFYEISDVPVTSLDVYNIVWSSKRCCYLLSHSFAPFVSTLQMCFSDNNFSSRMLQSQKVYKAEYYLTEKLPNYLMMF